MATGLQLSHANLFQEAINNGLQDFVLPSSLVATTAAGTPATGYFYSPIVGRSTIENIADNLRASLGIERIHTRIGYEVFPESGALSERVWAMPDENRIRFIGEWTFAYDSAREYRAKAGSASSAVPCYIEVLFYGTGLNLLISADSYSRAGITCSIDQGAYGSDLFTYVSAQPMTSTGKNYAPNQILNVSSGLTLGIHSAIIKLSSPQDIYGLEILNQQTSNIVVNSGTAFINGLKVTSTGGSFSCKAGVTGTKGGRQLVYLNSDGTLGSSFRSVDANTKYLTNATHENEELVKTYLPREFSAPMSSSSVGNDFTSNGISTAAQAYTLSDGSTTLNTSSSNISAPSSILPEGISISSLTNWIEFTFIGTGIDLVNFTGNGTALADTHTIQIDNSSVTVGNLSQSSTPICTKIASGLPYGTHVLKITRSTAMASQSVTTVNASTTVTTASTATFCVGASVTGTGIPAGAKVSSITNATTFVISAAATAAGTVTATFSAPCYISAFKVYQPKKPTLSSDMMEVADYNILADYTANTTANEINISSGVIRKTSIREAIYHSGIIHTALANTTIGSTTITLAASTTKISANCPVIGPGIPAGATVVSGSGTTYVISAAATATATGVTANFYNPASATLWSTGAASGQSVSGYSVQSNTGGSVGAQCTFYFFGTGVEVRLYQQGASSNTIFSIDGSSNFATMANGSGGTGITTSSYGPGSTITQSVTTVNASTNVTTASTSTITVGASITGTGIPAGAKVSSITNATTFVISAAATASGTITATLNTPFTFTPSTGILANDSGIYSSGVSFSNLPLGLHYITIYKNSATQLNIESFDIITPTYSPKSESIYVPNNNHLIGSNSISDSRNNSLISSKTNETIVAQSMDVQSNTTTTSTAFVPIVGTSVIVNSAKGGWYRVHWSATCSSSVMGTNGASWFRVMVDGQATQHSPFANASPDIADIYFQASAAGTLTPISIDKMIYLGPGTHLIQMQWRNMGNTSTCYSNTLNVVKEA